MEILGYLTLIIFLGLMLATLFGYIRTPVQTVLVLSTVLCLIVGGVFRYWSSGWDAVMLLPNEFLGGIILHPITALDGSLPCRWPEGVRRVRGIEGDS